MTAGEAKLSLEMRTTQFNGLGEAMWKKLELSMRRDILRGGGCGGGGAG